jgi:uncharacterized membrane protein YkoI
MKPILLLCAAVLLGAPEAAARCLTDAEMRRTLADAAVLRPAAIAAIALNHGGELVSMRLCDEGGAFVYRVVISGNDGSVARLVIDAASGNVLSGH